MRICCKRLRGIRQDRKANKRRCERTTGMSNKSKHALLFPFSPDPLLPALPCLRALNNPPPPGRGMSRREDRFAEPTGGHIRQTGHLNRPATVPCLTPVRPGSISHRHDKTGTSQMRRMGQERQTRHFCQLNFAAYSTPRDAHGDDERG